MFFFKEESIISATSRNIGRITIVYIERPTYKDTKLIDIRRIHATVPLSPKIRRFFLIKILIFYIYFWKTIELFNFGQVKHGLRLLLKNYRDSLWNNSNK